MESIIYKDLYIMKYLFGGFRIQTLKFRKGTIFNQMNKKGTLHSLPLSIT